MALVHGESERRLDEVRERTVPFWHKEQRVFRSPVFGLVVDSLHVGLYLSPGRQVNALNGGVFGSYALRGTEG